MSVWAQMLTKQPRSTLHGQDHVHERPDMLLYLYSKYIHAVIFLPLIFLSWTSVILSVCSVSGPHSMRRRVWSNPSLYHAQHAKCACSCLFSITRNMHFLPPLWNFDGRISLVAYVKYVDITLLLYHCLCKLHHSMMTRLSAALRSCLRKT